MKLISFFYQLSSNKWLLELLLTNEQRSSIKSIRISEDDEEVFAWSLCSCE
jgi:hypothetical protein